MRFLTTVAFWWLVGIVLVILKLSGLITLQWAWVAVPFWLPAAILLAVFFAVFVAVFIFVLVASWAESLD